MKIQFLRLMTLVTAVLFFSACSSMDKDDNMTENAGSQDKAAFEQAYQAAQAAFDKAGTVENAWSETQDRLNEARETADKADFATAIKLAERAKFESDTAYEQFVSQKNAGPSMF